MSKDGGPAFPMAVDCSSGTRTEYQIGMSLRDYFAAVALKGWMASESAGELLPDDKTFEESQRDQCKIIWSWADAMLAEREKS